MSQAEARVRTADLEAVLDCLGGLEMILCRFEADAPEDNHADVVAGLMSRHNDGGVWDPLRYNGEEPLGFGFVARNISELRERLLEGYADAAL